MPPMPSVWLSDSVWRSRERKVRYSTGTVVTFTYKKLCRSMRRQEATAAHAVSGQQVTSVDICNVGVFFRARAYDTCPHWRCRCVPVMSHSL